MSESENQNNDSAGPSPTEAEKSDSVQAELTKWKNDYLYLKADFENFRKRTIKERSDLIKYGGEYAFLGILTVLDNFDRALGSKSDESNFKSYKDGVELIAKEFKSVLTQFGVTEINSSDKKFDPSIYEAVGSINNDDVPEGHIVSVLRPAYKFHDKILRTGQVIVSLGPKKEEKKAET